MSVCIYGNVIAFEWMKFEKLRQSERCLLLFLCLFRPLSKAQLNASSTQPTHFCTQIEWLKQQQQRYTFPRRFVFPRSVWVYACSTVRHKHSPSGWCSVCIVTSFQSAMSSSYSMNPTHLKPLTALCACVSNPLCTLLRTRRAHTPFFQC